MTPELKAKWVEALRSGKFPQCTGVLTDGHGFCCLGVLREVMCPGDKTGITDDQSRPMLLSTAQLDIAGLSVDQTEYSDMNDNGSTFEEIANYIEERE